MTRVLSFFSHSVLRSIILRGVTLHQLRCFVAVAEDLHFGRAAVALGFSQPALSHQIRQLEDSVGSILLDRTSRRVKLTDAGRALLPGARRILAECEEALATVHDVTTGAAGHLELGAIPSAMHSVLPRIVRAVKASAPTVRLRVSELSTAAQIAQVAEGQLDAGFVRSPAALPTMLRSRVLVREAYVAVLPHHHPLARRERILMVELADEPFILWDRELNARSFDDIVAGCRRAGFEPRIELRGSGIEAQLGLVAAGLGVTVQASSYRSLRPADVSFVELADGPADSTLEVIWRSDRRSPALASLLDHAVSGSETYA
jgi:DNA-binding transcriptional LysR family regulator